jgi:4-hydroxybenzoate polyprenyltransferase
MVVALPLNEEFNVFSLFSMGLAMLAVQFAIGLSNDLLDQNYDKQAKPWKPLVKDELSIQSSKIIFVFLIIISFIFVYQFGFISIIIIYFGLILGLIYNLKLKRTLLSWLPYSLAIPTVMVYARVAHGNPEFELLLLLYPLGLLAGPALNIANQIPGAEKAKLSGERSLVHLFSPKNSGILSGLLLVSLFTLSIVILEFLGNLNGLITSALISALVFILIYFIFLLKDKYIFLWPISILIVSFLGLSFLFLIISIS